MYLSPLPGLVWLLANTLIRESCHRLDVLLLGSDADESLDNLALVEEQYRRDGADGILPGRLRVIVDVDLADFRIIVVVSGRPRPSP